MKKTIIGIISLALVVCAVLALTINSAATDLPFKNLFEEGFGGYTSDEGQILTSDYISSKEIEVTAGETLWFGPCTPVQYFHLVGMDAEGKTVTDKIRSKELTVVDTFGNNTVIYSFEVPRGVAKLTISAPADVAKVFTVSRTEINSVKYMAYWEKQGVNTDSYVGKNSYYKVTPGQKLYFGAITEEDALKSGIFNDMGDKTGTIAKGDLRLVERFGEAFGIYCYTVPEKVSFIRVAYDAAYQQYYHYLLKDSADTSTDEAIVDAFINAYGIPRPLDSTVATLSGKSALFVGDSITYGARDRAKIYDAGGWAGRIGYFAKMNVTNNGVSGACITTARVESHSDAHYIYNNLVKAKDQKFDYVIMHGLFNDASISDVEIGTAQGAAKFDPAKADVTKFASALELLFYTAKTQHPEAALGYIVNFHTDRAVDQGPFVAAAIAICDDWGIPFLDLYNRTGFSVEFDDGLHPSSAGYDSMYGIVANWMATLEKPEAVAPSSGSTADVMSYNVYFSPYSIPAGSISNRPNKVLSLIAENDPDILLLQEVSSDWMNLVKQAADAYSYYGYSHEQGKFVDNMASDDEATPILWKTEKYELVDSGHFWASNTPDVPSSTWNNGLTSNYPRCINWVVLKDKATGGMLLVSNIHGVPSLDQNDQEFRILSNQFIVQQLDAIRVKHGGIAIFIGGDWNMADGSAEYNIITGNSYRDLCKIAADDPKQGSYNAWDRTDPAKFAKGDYLFCSDNVSVTSYQVIVSDLDPDGTGLHISDHCPLVATIGY